METFRIRDKNTGMEVAVRGNQPPPAEALPHIFAKTRQSAAKMLETGDYKVDENFQALSKDQFREKTKKLAAQAIGVSPNDVDVDTGMGLWERTKLDQLRDDASKMEYLEKKFGGENVSALNIGGKPKMFYRDPKTKKMTMVDEMGASLADFTADISGEAITTVGAVGGAIAGTALTPFTGGVVNPVTGAIGGAALGGFLTGVTQDVVSEVATGQDVDVGDITKQRAFESTVGIAADVALPFVGRTVAKPFLRTVGKTRAAKGIMERVNRLSGRGIAEFDTLPAMTKGEKAIETAGRRAGETGGALTRAMQKNLDEASRASRVMAGEIPPTTPDKALFRMQKNIREEFAENREKFQALGRQSVEAIEANQRVSAEAIQKQLDAELSGLRPPRGFDPEESANSLRQSILTQRGLVQDRSRKNFNEALDGLEGVGLPAVRLQSILGRTVDDLAGVVDVDGSIISALSPSRAAQLGRGVNALDNMVNAGEIVPFRALHNLKQSLDSKAGYGAVSPSKEQLIARDAAGRVRSAINQLAESSGRAGSKYKDANKFFEDRITPFRTKQIAPMIAEDAAPGTFKMTGEKLSKNVIADTETVRQVLNSAGGLRIPIKKELQSQYLSVLETGKDFNPRIVRLLFGEDKLKSLERIKQLRAKADVKAGTVTEADIEELVGTLSGKSRKQVEDALADRIKLQQRADALLKRNHIISKIAKGEAPMPSDPRAFANNVLKEPDANVIRDFVSKMDDPSRRSFRAGVTHEMLNKAGFGGNAAARSSIKTGQVPMWKLGDVEKELMGKEAKYRAALGDSVFDDWIALDQVARANAITGTPVTEQVRAVFTTGSGILIVAAGIPKWAFGRVINAMSGSRMLRPWLRNVESDISQLGNALPFLLGTSQGVEALLVEAMEDPDFAELLESELSAQAQGNSPPQGDE